MEIPGFIALMLFASLQVQANNTACLNDGEMIIADGENVKGVVSGRGQLSTVMPSPLWGGTGRGVDWQ
jgi:hypothetical protein